MKRKNLKIKKFKEIIGNKKIEFEMASVDKVEELIDDVETVLDAVGHPEALVTDESDLGDFLSTFYEPEEVEAELNKLREILGIEIEDEYEKIVDLADRLRKERLLE